MRSRHPGTVASITLERKQNFGRRIHDNIPPWQQRGTNSRGKHSEHNNEQTTSTPMVQGGRSKTLD